ncbi:MAG: hypothetical protein H6720_16325 [Sandaracinus sp.]|nr:hypothetical protein [Sandaracinus sp.]
MKRTAGCSWSVTPASCRARFDELEALPGVGHKTAQVVLAQAFEIPAFPVDTHIHRLAERWGLSSGKNVDTTEKDLKAFFPEDTWIRRHLQIIYFGREHCPARGHDPKVCPICSWAAPKDATSSDTTKAAPKPAKAKKAGANESAESAAPKKNTKKSAERAEPKKATKKSAESAAPKKTAKKASKATTAKSAGRKSS